MPLIHRDVPAPDAWPPPRDAASVAQLLRYVRLRDPVGHQVHSALGIVYLLMLPLAPSLEAISFGLLVGYALIRLPNSWRCYTPLLRDRLLWFFALWTLIHGLSIAWSIDPVEGWTELKAFRVIFLPLALWPVLDRVPWLIGALFAGVFVTNLVQGAQALEWFNLTTEGDDRARAGLHPIQTGAFCAVAIVWYAVAMLQLRLVRPYLTLALFVGCGAAVLGLLYSGSRGPWLAAAFAVPVALLVIMVRQSQSRPIGAVLIIFALVAAVPLWTLGGGDYVRHRVQNAMTEYQQAREGDFTTAVGKRVIMNTWAVRFFAQSPLYGHGAGSYRQLTRDTPEYRNMAAQFPHIQRSIRRGRVRDSRITAAHPHSTYLQILTGTGIIGFVPFLACVIILLARCARERRDHLFAGAALFVCLVWLIGANFDSYHLNGHLFGLFAFLASISIPHRPPPRPFRAAAESGNTA